MDRLTLFVRPLTSALGGPVSSGSPPSMLADWLCLVIGMPSMDPGIAILTVVGVGGASIGGGAIGSYSGKKAGELAYEVIR